MGTEKPLKKRITLGFELKPIPRSRYSDDDQPGPKISQKSQKPPPALFAKA
jgi:hypothetical protein